MRARKRFGQHFLQAAWAAKIAEAAGLAPTDAVLEIGPGQGVLTRALLARHPALVAVELDRDLIAALRESLPHAVRIIEGDILAQSWTELLAAAAEWHEAQTATGVTSVRVVGNLPYNIASPLLIAMMHATRAGAQLRDALVMVQREVADRVCASPDTGDYGPLGVALQTWADVQRVMDVPPGAFRPMPKVWSSVIRLTWRPSDLEIGSLAAFDQVTRRVFQQRRKQLSNALQGLAVERGADAEAWLAAAGLDGTRRPGTLTRPELARLSDVIGPSPARPVL